MAFDSESNGATGDEDRDDEGMGCWWLVAIGIVVLLGLLTAFLVLTGG